VLSKAVKFFPIPPTHQLKTITNTNILSGKSLILRRASINFQTTAAHHGFNRGHAAHECTRNVATRSARAKLLLNVSLDFVDARRKYTECATQPLPFLALTSQVASRVLSFLAFDIRPTICYLLRNLPNGTKKYNFQPIQSFAWQLFLTPGARLLSSDILQTSEIFRYNNYLRKYERNVKY